MLAFFALRFTLDIAFMLGANSLDSLYACLYIQHYRPELVGMVGDVGDVLLAAMSDRLVFRSATTPSAVAYIADRPFTPPDHVIALDDSRRIN